MVNFFASLALSGSLLLPFAVGITTLQDDASSLPNAGRRQSSVGLFQTGETLYAPPFSNNDTDLIGFGTSVALSKNDGSRLVVGAPLWGNQSTAGTGGVFVYDYDGTEWGIPTSNFVQDFFGTTVGDRLSLSADGSVLAVRTEPHVALIDLESEQIINTIDSIGAAVTLSYDGSLVAVSEESFESGKGRVLLYPTTGSVSPDDAVPLTGADPFDRFGFSTAFNAAGNRLAISAPNHFSKRGLVRVYEKVGEKEWSQLGNDLLGDDELEQFGFSLAFSGDGDTVVAGSPQSSGGGSRRGKVRAYRFIDDAWTKAGNDIQGEETMDQFGRAAAINYDGTRIAASSFFYGGQRGRIRYVEWFDDDWVPFDEIVGDDEVDRLGYGLQSISMTSDGSRIAAGAVRALDENMLPSGQVKVFDYKFDASYELPPTSAPSSAPSVSASPSALLVTMYSIIDDIQGATEYSGEGSSQFGWAVDLSKNGKFLAVGAPKHDWDMALNSDESVAVPDAGGVYLYKLVDEANWLLQWFLEGNENEKIGNRISLSKDGSRIAFRRRDPPSVEVYDVSDMGEVALSGIPIIPGERGETVTLSADGSLLAVSGEYREQGRGYVSVYTFLDGLNWTIAFNYELNETNPLTRFGWATSFSEDGNRLAVSAPNYNLGNEDRVGLVQVFERDSDSTNVWTPIGEPVVGSEGLEQLGFSMALSGDGNTLVMGSPGSSGGGVLRGKVSAFRWIDGKWTKVGNDIPGADGNRLGRAVALSHDGDRLAVTSIFHNDMRGQVQVYDLVDEEYWLLGFEAEGDAPGDRLGFGVTGLTISGDGSRVVTGMERSSDSPISSVRTFDLLATDDEAYVPDPTDDLPVDFQIIGCVCNEVRVCNEGPVVPGTVLHLCLDTGAEEILFAGIDVLNLVEQDLKQLTYRSIENGIAEFGTSVTMEGSSCYIETPLMTFFEGSVGVKAEGVALLRYDDDARFFRARFLSDIPADFGVDVLVEKAMIRDSPNVTSDGVTLIGSIISIAPFAVATVFFF